MRKVDQDGAGVVDRVEDVGVRFAIPAVCTVKAVVRGVVVGGVDEVQRGGPLCVNPDLIGPGGHRREVAGPVVASHLVEAGVGAEDVADGAEDLRVEVGLGDGSNNFVTFVWRSTLA